MSARVRKPRQRSVEIREFVLGNVSDHPRDITALTAATFEISRPAALRHINALIGEGLLIAHGTTRDRSYELRPLVDERVSVGLSPDTEEDRIWRHLVRPLMRELAANVLSICEYGVNEMVNNAIEHSEGSRLEIHVQQSAAEIDFAVHDDGVGIFNKLARELDLEDRREAILELAKGKVTTDPDHHTGEGIFFVSRMFDRFVIASEGLYYSADAAGDGGRSIEAGSERGTTVYMGIKALTDRTIQEVFDRYAAEDFDYAFSKTDVPVALARLGSENLVSRSQARRVMLRLGEFQEITLDFDGVDRIGQPFADEIFRVYAGNHPEVNMRAVNVNEAVERMIRRAGGETSFA